MQLPAAAPAASASKRPVPIVPDIVPSYRRNGRSLALDRFHGLVQYVAVNFIAQPRLRGRRHISVFVDANLIFEIGTVRTALWLGHFKPDAIRHCQLAVEMYRVIENAAPIVRLALHAKTFRQTGDFHAAGDPTDIVYDEPNYVDGSATNVLAIVVRREDELANGDGYVEGSRQSREAIDIACGNRILVGHIIQLIQHAADLDRLFARITSNAVEQ